jgi:uncharacterized protein (TIGR03067 family)
MAVVSCPECSKRLKVADTSLGKKVKCSCGNIFVAEEGNGGLAAPKKPAAVVAPEKVFVSCSECGSKLKVATTSLGKKMKCPKCASVFIANIEDEEPPPPPRKVVKTAPPPDDDDEEAPSSRPKAKAKPKKNEEEMDALFSFAQAEAEADDQGAIFDEERSTVDDDDDEEEIRPKAKPPAKGKARPVKPRYDDDDDDDEDEAPPKKRKPVAAPPAKPVYPSRLLVNIFVFFMLLAYVGFFVSVEYFGVDLGLKKTRPIVQPKKKDDRPSEPAWADRLAARQKEEKEWSSAFPPRPDVPGGVLAIWKPETSNAPLDLAFAVGSPTLASLASDNDKVSVQLWDLKTLKPGKSFPASIAAEPGARMTFSPKGDLIAAIAKRDKAVKIWQTSDGKELKSLSLEKDPEDIVFSSDGKHLLVQSGNAVEGMDVIQWNIADWKNSKFNKDSAKDVVYLLSPAGDKIVEIQTTQKKLFIHELDSGKKQEVKDIPERSYQGARLSPAGTHLALSAKDGEGSESVQTLSLEPGKTPIELSVEKMPVDRLTFSWNGKYVAYTVEGDMGQVKIFEIAPPKLRWSGPARAFAFSPGGAFIALAQADSVQLLSFEEMIAAKELEGDWKLDAMTMDGKSLPKEAVQKMRFNISADKVRIFEDDKQVEEDGYKLDAAKRPMHFDMIEAKATKLAICKLEGDTLFVCNAMPDKARPTKFDASNGSGNTLTILKRSMEVKKDVEKKDVEKKDVEKKDIEKKDIEKKNIVKALPAGDWQVVSAIGPDGKKESAEKTQKMKYTTTADKLSMFVDGKLEDDNSYKLDATKDPMHLDILALTGDTEGKTFLSICKLGKNTLTICSAGPDMPRPTAFAGGKGFLLVELERMSGKEKIDEKKTDEKKIDKPMPPDGKLDAKAAITKLKSLGADIREIDGEVKSVSFRKATNEALALLAALPTLEEIDLTSAREVSDAGLVHLKGLPNLKTLKFTDVGGVTDAGMPSLAGIKSLEELNLAGTGVTDKGLIQMGVTGRPLCCHGKQLLGQYSVRI